MVMFEEPLFRYLSGPQVIHSALLNEVLPAEQTVDVALLNGAVVSLGPLVDVFTSSPRFPLPQKRNDNLPKEFLISSVCGHGLFFLLIVLLLQLRFESSRFDQTAEDIPVVMTFGLVQKPSQSKLNLPQKERQILPEAQKTEQLLPQLPKNYVLDVPESPVDTKALPEPKRDETKNRPQKVTLTQENSSAAKGSQKISQEDLLKRAERESRSIGSKEQVGQHAPSTQKGSAAHAFDVPLPESPFESSLPEAPPGLSPAGEMTGTAVSSQAVDAYRLAALRHMRQHWRMTMGKHFDPRLKVRLGFDVNSLGRIIGPVHVLKSSGESAFDDEAIEGVKAASPFPDLPKGFGKTKLILDLEPQESQ